MSGVLYSNRAQTFAVSIYDTDGVTVLPGSTWTGAEYRIFPSDDCTPVVSKSLGSGIVATTGEYSFIVELGAADITVSGIDGEYIHSFTTVDDPSGESQPDIIYGPVSIVYRCPIS